MKVIPVLGFEKIQYRRFSDLHSAG